MGILSLFLALALTQEAQTWQEGLTPTDVLSMGRVTVAARLSAEIGSGSLQNDAVNFDENGDISRFDLLLEGAVGIGMNFEIEATLPVTFVEKLEISSGGIDFKQESKGLGDLSLGLNWAALRDGKDSVQLMFGAFVLLPTGDDERGQPEASVNGVQTLVGEEGGMGTGAFQFGFQAGISKRLSVLEPYLLFRYLVGGHGDDGDIKTDFPDVATLIVGSEFHFGDALTIDGRLIVNLTSEEVREDDTGGETTTASYSQIALQGRVYLSLGPTVTLIAGVGAYNNSDHELIQEANLELNDVWVFTAELGLQIALGK